MSSTRKTILVTGARGRLASRLYPLLEPNYDLILTDVFPCQERNVSQLDILNEEASYERCQGSDVILHCAIAPYDPGDSSQSEAKIKSYHESMFEINVKGTYRLYEAARRAKMQHVVYVSSMTIVLGSGEAGKDSSIPPCPVDLYAVTKLFGEHVGELYSRKYGIRTTVVRLGQPFPLGLPQEQAWRDDERIREILVPHSTIAKAITDSIEQPRRPLFEVSHVYGGIEETLVS